MGAGQVIGVTAIVAGKIRQKNVDVSRGQVIVLDEGLQTGIVEFYCAWGGALSSGDDKITEEFRIAGVFGRPYRSRTCDTLIKSQGSALAY